MAPFDWAEINSGASPRHRQKGRSSNNIWKRRDCSMLSAFLCGDPVRAHSNEQVKICSAMLRGAAPAETAQTDDGWGCDSPFHPRDDGGETAGEMTAEQLANEYALNLERGAYGEWTSYNAVHTAMKLCAEAFTKQRVEQVERRIAKDRQLALENYASLGAKVADLERERDDTEKAQSLDSIVNEYANRLECGAYGAWTSHKAVRTALTLCSEVFARKRQQKAENPQLAQSIANDVLRKLSREIFEDGITVDKLPHAVGIVEDSLAEYGNRLKTCSCLSRTVGGKTEFEHIPNCTEKLLERIADLERAPKGSMFANRIAHYKTRAEAAESELREMREALAVTSARCCYCACHSDVSSRPSCVHCKPEYWQDKPDPYCGVSARLLARKAGS